MLALARCSAPVALVVFFGAALSGCSSVDLSGRELVESFKPYQVAVVQGNFVSREQVQALQPGMSRQQVRDILGTPLVASLFHADRWDYVFTLKRPGEDVQTRKLVVTFEGEHFVRAEGDEMPSEAEFVATLIKPMGKIKVPALQATEEQLAKFSVPKNKAPEAEAPEPVAPQRSYPPLESR